MSTLAYVGNFEPEWSTENDVRLAFEHLGWDVVQLQEDKVNQETVMEVATVADLLLWTGTWDNSKISGGDFVSNLLHELALRCTPSATLHLDTFWSTHRGGRLWWQHPMFRMGLVCTADGGMKHQVMFERMGVRHHWLRPGVRHTVPTQLGEWRSEYACDVSFVGASGCGDYHPEWEYRCKLTQALEFMCERNGWTYRNPGGKVRGVAQPKVTRDRMADFYASCRVTVGDSLCPDREESLYWSDRVYEATGRAACLVMPDIIELNSQREFDTCLPIYPWGNWRELEYVVRLLLEDRRLNDRARVDCRDVTVRQNTYVNRVQELLEAVA